MKKIVAFLYLIILCITLRAQSAHLRLDSLFNNINKGGEITGQYSYTDSPALIYTITANIEGRIFAQLGDQPAVEILPKSDVELFYIVIDAKLKFERKQNIQIDTFSKRTGT